MKKENTTLITFLYIFIITILLLLLPYIPSADAAGSPSTTKSKVTLYTGYKTYQIKFENLSSRAVVTYKSGNKNIASVTSDGIIKPVAIGETTVTVTMKQNSKIYTSKISVTVKIPYISITKSVKALKIGSSYSFEGKAVGIANASLYWSTSDNSIAAIDQRNGTLIAIRGGTVTITLIDINTGINKQLKVHIMEPSDNKEVNYAIELKLVPSELQNSYTLAINFRQFCTMLKKMIVKSNKSLGDKWDTVAKLALASEVTMKREDGMLALLYAAEVMGLDTKNNQEGYQVNARIGDSVWRELSNDYPYFPMWNQKKTVDKEWKNYMVAAYYYALLRCSPLTGNPVFDVDTNRNSLRVRDTFTRQEAILATLRLYESQFSVTKRIPGEEDEKILAAAEKLRSSIRSSKTSVTVTGTKYYVSNYGSDSNDGLSYKTPWATLDKVNSFKFKDGDAVMFRRGGLWRGALNAQAGVTYSAYGKGDKPKIYGSPEDAADPSKWSLLNGTDNIWVFYREITDCGTLVFNNGEKCAIKDIPSYKNGRFVLRDDPGKPYDVVTQLDKNLKFFSEADSHLTKGVPYVYSSGRVTDVVGKLYLRCDKGNPGKVFQSIELLTRPYIITPANNTVFDNLCLKYGGSHAIFSFWNPITVQNCEIGWIGGAIQYYSDDSGKVVRFGNAVEAAGSYNKYIVKNCYIYQIYDAGLTNQDSYGTNSKSTLAENIAYTGNLIEYCTYGLEIFLRTDNPSKNIVRNILIDNNMILYTGYGWGKQRPDKNTPASIQMWDHYNPIRDIRINNNTFYLSTKYLIWCGSDPAYRPLLSGNTFVQNKYGLLTKWRVEGDMKVYNVSTYNIKDIINNILGDRSATVIQ